jgi:hypothetical protein
MNNTTPAQKITAADIQKALGGEYEIRQYSGRCMFGKQCVAIEYDTPDDMFRMGVLLGRAGLDTSGAQTDQMGRGYVVYFPEIEWSEE